MKKLLLALISLPLLFTSCVINIDSKAHTYNDYDDEDLYQIGSADITGELESVEIDWVAGDVDICLNNSDIISFEESSSSSLRDNLKLRYYYNESKKSLVIKYCHGNMNVESHFTKDLKLLVPANATLKSLKINDVTGQVTSEDVPVVNCEVNKTTGDLELTLPGETSKLKVNSTTSDIIVNSGFVRTVEINSTTGNIQFRGYTDAPDSININNTTGKVELTLPENSGFTVELNSILNKIETNQFSGTTEKGKFIYKDGKKNYKIKLTSSGLSLYKYKPSCCK